MEPVSDVYVRVPEANWRRTNATPYFDVDVSVFHGAVEEGAGRGLPDVCRAAGSVRQPRRAVLC